MVTGLKCMVHYRSNRGSEQQSLDVPPIGCHSHLQRLKYMSNMFAMTHVRMHLADLNPQKACELNDPVSLPQEHFIPYVDESSHMPQQRLHTSHTYPMTPGRLMLSDFEHA